MKTVDSSGVVVNEYEYDVYGTLRSSSGSQDNEFRFAGQQTDPTGLQYLRARYYDMETGQFLSRDPLAASQDWSESPFAYGSANVTNFVDPLGLCPSKWPVAGRVCNRGAKVIGSIGAGALQLVNLSGEYILRTGRSFDSWWGENKDVVTFVVGEVLAGAVAVCFATGFGAPAGVAGFAGCSAIMGAYIAFTTWYVSGANSDVGRLVRAINMIPVMGRFSAVKAVFDAIASGLAPTPAR
jgi:RHS repeat-associated protein